MIKSHEIKLYRATCETCPEKTELFINKTQLLTWLKINNWVCYPGDVTLCHTCVNK